MVPGSHSCFIWLMHILDLLINEPMTLLRSLEEKISYTCAVQQVNVLGLHHMVACWIKSPPDPKNPVRTIINVSSGLEGIVSLGLSAYCTSKLAGHRYMEFVAASKWRLRSMWWLRTRLTIWCRVCSDPYVHFGARHRKNGVRRSII